MHHKRKHLEKVFQRHTLQHHHFFTHENMNCKDHRDFKVVLFPPVLLVFFFFCFVLPASLLIYWLWSANAGLLFMAGILAYYLNYEWLHLTYHLPDGHPVTRLPVIRSLRTAHLHHHDPALMQKYNFNISYPLFDKIFGTYYKS